MDICRNAFQTCGKGFLAAERAMTFSPQIQDKDVASIAAAMANRPDTRSVAEFVPGPGIQKLDLKFDIDRLREALDECLARGTAPTLPDPRACPPARSQVGRQPARRAEFWVLPAGTGSLAPDTAARSDPVDGQ